MAETPAVTLLLDAARKGKPDAVNRLFDAVYGELRQMAAMQMAQEHGPRTLQPTALVHEAYLKLIAGDTANQTKEGGATPSANAATVTFENRRHFFGAVAQAMRQIRIDYARKRVASKRDPGTESCRLDVSITPPAVLDDDPTELMALGEAMKKLRHEHPELAEVVDLCYSLGLTQVQAAELLGISRRTVQGYWEVARGLLCDMMS